MASWKITTQHKKSCEEHAIWSKDGKEFKIISGFRWGTFFVETTDDNTPELDLTNPDGYDFYSMYDVGNIESAELESMDDGWYGDYEFSDDFTEEEQEELKTLWEDDSYDGLEGAGWINDDTEAWLFGPLQVEDMDGNVVAQGEADGE